MNYIAPAAPPPPPAGAAAWIVGSATTEPRRAHDIDVVITPGLDRQHVDSAVAEWAVKHGVPTRAYIEWLSPVPSGRGWEFHALDAGEKAVQVYGAPATLKRFVPDRVSTRIRQWASGGTVVQSAHGAGDPDVAWAVTHAKRRRPYDYFCVSDFVCLAPDAPIAAPAPAPAPAAPAPAPDSAEALLAEWRAACAAESAAEDALRAASAREAEIRARLNALRGAPEYEALAADIGAFRVDDCGIKFAAPGGFRALEAI